MAPSGTRLFAKLEWYNPTGSVKDRPAWFMFHDAKEQGVLTDGMPIIEATSGNTGIGLARVALINDHPAAICLPASSTNERKQMLRAYGAEVVVCPVAVPPEDPASYYSTAERLVQETPNAFRPNQYGNPHNPRAHFETTGPEIWRQTDGRITHFVAGAGTGGTLSGVGRYLKSQNPDVQIVAADPEGSVYSGGSGRPYLVEGVGEDFWPSTYDPSVVDRVIPISDRDSFLTARRVSEQEGLLIGGSCGTAVAASLQLAEELTADDLVVVLIPDSGRGYLSRVFNDEWMAGFGFLTADGPTVSDVVLAKDGDVPRLVYLQPTDSLRDAVKLMHEHDVSQLPVAKGEMPLAAAEVMGSIDELRIMELAFGDPSILDASVEEVMSPHMPTVGMGQPVELAAELLDQAPALLVLDGGRPRTVVARADLLSFLSIDSTTSRG